MLALWVYDPYLRGTDILIDARSSSFSDGCTSLLMGHFPRVGICVDATTEYRKQ